MACACGSCSCGMWSQAQELLAEVLKGHVEAAVAAGAPAPTELQEYEEYEEYEETATPRGATPEATLDATPGAMLGAMLVATPETMPGATPATPSSGGTIQLGEGGARSSSLPRVPRAAAAAAAAVAAMQHAAAAVGSGRRDSMYQEGEAEGEQEGGNSSDDGDGSDGSGDGGDGGDGGDAAAHTPS
eukprot:scaffold2707_cov55-Phaeocystis_antarctica.AAC.10